MHDEMFILSMYLIKKDIYMHSKNRQILYFESGSVFFYGVSELLDGILKFRGIL